MDLKRVLLSLLLALSVLPLVFMGDLFLRSKTLKVYDFVPQEIDQLYEIDILSITMDMFKERIYNEEKTLKTLPGFNDYLGEMDGTDPGFDPVEPILVTHEQWPKGGMWNVTAALMDADKFEVLQKDIEDKDFLKVVHNDEIAIISYAYGVDETDWEDRLDAIINQQIEPITKRFDRKAIFEDNNYFQGIFFDQSWLKDMGISQLVLKSEISDGKIDFHFDFEHTKEPELESIQCLNNDVFELQLNKPAVSMFSNILKKYELIAEDVPASTFALCLDGGKILIPDMTDPNSNKYYPNLSMNLQYSQPALWEHFEDTLVGNLGWESDSMKVITPMGTKLFRFEHEKSVQYSTDSIEAKVSEIDQTLLRLFIRPAEMVDLVEIEIQPEEGSLMEFLGGMVNSLANEMKEDLNFAKVIDFLEISIEFKDGKFGGDGHLVYKNKEANGLLQTLKMAEEAEEYFGGMLEGFQGDLEEDEEEDD